MLPITRATAQKFCRGCLQECIFNFKDKDICHDMLLDTRLHKWFNDITNLPAPIPIMFPNLLCHTCYTKTRLFYEFKDKSLCVAVAISEIIRENELTDVMVCKLKTFCATCLRKLMSLENGTFNLRGDNKLLEWLNACTGISFGSDASAKSMPTYVCSRCFKKLRNFFEFQKLTRESQEFLDTIFDNIEQKVSDEQCSEENQIAECTNVVSEALSIESIVCNEQDVHENFDNYFIMNSDLIDETNRTDDNIPNTDSEHSLKKYNVDLYNVHKGIAEPVIDERNLMSEYDCLRQQKADEMFVTNIKDDPLNQKNINEMEEFTFVHNNKIGGEFSTRNQENVKCFKCINCEKTFDKKYTYEAHIRRMHDGIKQLYQCAICLEKFRTYKCMHRHCTEAHGEINHTNTKTSESKSKWSCTICDLSFELKRVLKDHIAKEHGGMKSFQCEYCQKYFQRKHHLKEHVNAVHHGIRSFKCKFCDKAFAAKKTKRVHEMGHTGERPFRCSYCNKNFRQASDLKIHLEKHTTDPSLLCPYCYRAKSSRKELEEHLLQHNSNKYQCTKCGKTFTKISHLKEHDSVVHLQLRPFKCNYCEKSFGARKTLRTHELIHVEKWPLSCPVCQKGFRVSTSLKKHLCTHKSNEISQSTHIAK